MVKNLYVMGTAGSGKTAVALGLALKFKELGHRVAYFKPVGSTGGTVNHRDEDAELMQSVLDIKLPLEAIVPFTAGPSYLSGYRHCISPDKVQNAYRKVAEGADIVIIGGTGFPHIMGCLGLDAVSLARELKASVLFLIRIENDYSLDNAIFINNYLTAQNIPLLGNIFNNISRPLLAKTEGIYSSILREKGYRTLGIIPRQVEITSPTVAEYYEALGGELLTGENNMNRPVEDLIVGAMTIESALGYLRRAPNKAVITGGDRSDLALSALETSTSVLILTGGLYPDVKVTSRAEEKGVPVILVHYDTYTTLEKCSEVTRRIRSTDRRTIEMARENIENHCDWQTILQLLG